MARGAQSTQSLTTWRKATPSTSTNCQPFNVNEGSNLLVAVVDVLDVVDVVVRTVHYLLVQHAVLVDVAELVDVVAVVELVDVVVVAEPAAQTNLEAIKMVRERNAWGRCSVKRD